MSKCKKCGKPGHYAKTCGATEATKPARKRKPKSWVKSLTAKLSDAAEPDDAPPNTPGEPFADLPPLDMGPAPEATDPAAAPTEAAGDTSTSAPNDTAKDSPKSKLFETTQLQGMAHGFVKDGTLALGKFAMDRGFIAFGEEFAEAAGISAAYLIKLHAAEMEIDDEKAAIYTIGIVSGGNLFQFARAYYAELEAKKKARANATNGKPPDAATASGPVPAVANPIPESKPIPDDQRLTRPGGRGGYT